MNAMIDLTGHKYGRLLVLSLCPPILPYRKPRWHCQCLCGNTADVSGSRLRNGGTRSCGCLRRDRMGQVFKRHGKSKTPEYCMFYDARKRAMRMRLPFSIEPTDINIPTHCPVFGIPLSFTGKRDNRPNLDRFIPSLGYTKENIRVISFRANRIKTDATFEEIGMLLNWMRQ